MSERRSGEVVDGNPFGAGVSQSAAPTRAKPSPLHAGITLSTDNRCFVCASMVYLIASGAWLAWHGALIAEGPLRVVGVHLFATGFVLPLIYGLGAHTLPRFTGNPIAMGRLPWVQLAALNVGILLFLGGATTGMRNAAFTGGALIWFSLGVFAWRVWGVLWPRGAHVRANEGRSGHGA